MIHTDQMGTDLVRLIDFGIAKVEENKTDGHTSTLVLAGTTRYMAPEQLLGSGSYSADIFALGVVAYEMLTGRCPYQSESAFAVLKMQMTRQLARPRKLRPDLPIEAERLILKALSFHPEQRPLKAGMFSANLASALTRPFPATRRMAKRVISLLALIVLPLAGISAWHNIQRRYEAPLVRIVEKRDSTSPVADGFAAPSAEGNDISGDVALNSEKSGYEGWRAITRSQGYYVRELTAAQVKTALARGWSISAVTRVEKGGAFVIVDFKDVGRRFDVFAFLDENGELAVRLITQLLPSLEGPEYRLKGEGIGFHRFDLIYNSTSRLAELLVDGVPRLRDYAGHTEYANHSWIAFGPHVYRTSQAIATYQTLRFEINP